jgi:predicted  nucleic acid-binding Zn-ribbon protein
VISGCATKSEFKDLKNRMDALESNKIQSIEGQISSIDTSLGLLDQTDDQLEGYINALKEQVLELEVDCGEERETLEAAIKALQTEDESLHKQIDELKAYVGTELNGVKDWASATFVTLEEYNKTVDVIAGIKANLDTLHTGITNEYQQAIEEAIGKSAESMKTWVNELLTGYYDIATMNTKLDSLKSALEKQLNEQGGDLEGLIGQNTKGIATLESDLKQAKTDITDAYKKAIEEAITKYDGTITETLQKEIDGVNETIDALDDRVSDLETAVGKLENRMDEVEKALKSLASITNIPKYSDNKERVGFNVRFNVSGTKYITSDLNLRFDVYPASGAQAIADAYTKDKSIISARAVYTLTKIAGGDFVNLSVSDVTASDDGILTVTVSPDGLDKDFFDGKYEASLVLKISTGYNNIQSDYIGLVPVRELSLFESANCYLVQAAGDYEFKAVQGNTFKIGDSGKTGTSVGTVASADVLWESFGTSIAPKKGELIASTTYSDGYIQFSIPADFKQGNAVIAAKDASGTILWSWHIWCAKEGWKELEYYNKAGTMMDRNLGATTATAGEVGSLGLLYQWGRKDPFLGSSSVSTSTKAASTGTWSTSDESVTENSTKNPMTFYKGAQNYMSDKSWNITKAVNDPCPAGWRVPDEKIWSNAKESSTPFSITGGAYGLNFGKVFGSDETIWYPASGSLYNDSELFSVGDYGGYWSVTPNPSYNNVAYGLGFGSDGLVYPLNSTYRYGGASVRCLQE